MTVTIPEVSVEVPLWLVVGLGVVVGACLYVAVAILWARYTWRHRMFEVPEQEHAIFLGLFWPVFMPVAILAYLACAVGRLLMYMTFGRTEK